MASYFSGGKKSQVALEQLIITAVFLFLLLSIFVYADTSYVDATRFEQASEAVRTLATAANRIYETGSGTKTFVYVTLPDSIIYSNITGDEVTISLETSKGPTEVTGATKGHVNGSIPLEAGTYKVCLEVLESGIVDIYECKITLIQSIGDVTPPSIIFARPTPDNAAAINSSTVEINATVTDDVMVTSCTLHFDGSFEDMTVIGSGASVTCYRKKTSLANGWHNYYVTAVDGSLNEGYSETRSVMINVTSGGDKTERKAMLTYYDAGAGQTPRYRLWNKSAWSDELTALDTGTTASSWHLLLANGIRDEKALFTKTKSQSAKPTAVAQIWNGTDWGNLITLSTYNGEPDSPGSYDAVYEQSSGRLMVIYMEFKTSASIPRYRIWNGTGWSAEGNLNNPQCGNVKFVKLAAKPNSDEIIAAVLGQCSYLHGQVWNGTDWGNSILLSTNVYTYTSQEYDIAYGQNSGRAMVAWQDSNIQTPKYRIWNGTGWEAEKNASSIGASSGLWYKLATKKGTDNMLLATVDNNQDLNVQFWDGASWGAATELDSSVESYATPVKSFDAAYEQSSSPERVMVAYADDDDTIPKYYLWDGASWGAKRNATDIGSQPYWIELEPDIKSNDMFLATNDEDEDVNVQLWSSVSGNFSEKFEAEVSAISNQMALGIAFDRHY